MPDPLDYAPFTRQHRFAIFVCALGSFCDVVEITVGTLLSSVLSGRTSGVTAAQLSWLLAAPVAGAVVATPLLGLLADRAGRRSMLVAALSTLAIISFCSALSADIPWLIGFRMISGIGIGELRGIHGGLPGGGLTGPHTRGRTLLFAYAIGAIRLARCALVRLRSFLQRWRWRECLAIHLRSWRSWRGHYGPSGDARAESPRWLQDARSQCARGCRARELSDPFPSAASPGRNVRACSLN